MDNKELVEALMDAVDALEAYRRRYNEAEKDCVCEHCAICNARRLIELFAVSMDSRENGKENMSLKDTTLTAHALAAYREQLEDEAKREAARLAKRVEAARGAFLKMFGFHGNVGQDADGTVFVTSGDLTLRALFHSYSVKVNYFELASTCPDCGADYYSTGIHGLEDLGKQIKEFVPQYGHKCAPDDVRCPTAGEALLEALQNYIEEEAYVE